MDHHQLHKTTRRITMMVACGWCLCLATAGNFLVSFTAALSLAAVKRSYITARDPEDLNSKVETSLSLLPPAMDLFVLRRRRCRRLRSTM